MRIKTRALILLLSLAQIVQSQNYPFEGNTGSKIAFKISSVFFLYARIKSGDFYKPSGNLSVAFGAWNNFRKFQPGSNLSATMNFGPWHLGNNPTDKNKLQLNLVLTPMLTYALDKNVNLFYDEINPSYLGFATAVYSNYKNQITLGTSFVMGPKGRFKNINTPRNKSQQLIYLGIKKSLGVNSNISLNVCEDYLGFTDNAIGENLCDNRDRFYTGGGNVQFRLNNEFVFKYYSEVYTGISYPNVVAYPDLVISEDTIGSNNKFIKKFAGPKRFLRVAFQDPGQHLLNTGRNVFALEYTPHILPNTQLYQTISTPKVQLFIGTQEGNNNMWIQNAIHNGIKIKKFTSTGLRTNNNGSISKEYDRFHRFMPREKKARFLLGVGCEGVVR